MKRFNLLLFTLAIVICIHAEDFVVDEIRYRTTSDTTVDVIWRGYYGDINIPEKVKYRGNAYQVTRIGDGAFGGCPQITSIVIPNSVTSIGGSAFSECTGLTSITIPNSVTILGKNAFWGCKGLISIVLSNCLTTIEDGTFIECTRLTSIVIPNSVTRIG